MKYAFNENIRVVSGTPGQVVPVMVCGFRMQVTIGKDGYATINESPFIQALWADEPKNFNDTSFEPVKVYEGVTYKYGYLDLDEQSERFGTQRARYNDASEAGRCQVKLRWLDHYGNWCYWIFEKGSTAYTDAQKGETLTGVIGRNAVSRPQMKTNAKSVTVCAPKVDEETFEFLTDIKRSINVCIEGDNEWIPVVVGTGTATWVVDGKRMSKQDFEITLTTPENVLSL